MKAAVIYFSGTGNTHRIGTLYGSKLESIGYEVQFVDISKFNSKLEKYDLIIIGSPTYSKVAIMKLQEFMDEHITIEHLKNSKFATFITHSWGKAFGHITLMKHLELLGANVVSAQAYLMPNNYYMMSGKKHDKSEMNELYSNAIKQVTKIIESYEMSSKTIDSKNTIKRKMMEGLYKRLRKDYIPNFAIKFLSVDEKQCTQCGLCVEACPNKNIQLNQNKIEFESDCLACSRCFNRCPANAFSIKGKSIDQYKENMEFY